MKTSTLAGLIAFLPVLPPALNAALVITPSAGFTLTWDGNEGENFNAAEVAPVPANLATGAGAIAISSGQLAVGPHFTPTLNDGRYGNSNSWIGGEGDSPAYAGIALDGTFNLTSFAFGRDNGNNVTDPQANGYLGQLPDRSLGVYTLQFTSVASPSTAADTGLSATGWQTFGSLNYAGEDDTVLGGAFTSYYRHEFEVGLAAGGGLTATGFRILVPGTGISPAGTAIDEIELFGTAVPEPSTSLILLLGLAGAGFFRRR